MQGIGIFGHRAVKMYNKFRRETFRTITAKFQRKILAPGENFQILPIWFVVPIWHSALGRVPLLHFGTLHQWFVKFFYTIFTRFVVESEKSEFSPLGRPKRVKNSKEKLSAPLVQSCKGIYCLQVKILEFYPSGLRCRCGTLHSAECVQSATMALRNSAPLVRKVSLHDFSPFWG